MAYLDTLVKRKEGEGGYLDVVTNSPAPRDYSGTLGEMPLNNPTAMKTSTQAVPDETTGPNPIIAVPKILAQGLAQGFAATGAELASVPGRLKDVAQGKMPSVPFGQSQFVPIGKIQQAILGTDKPISYATTGALPGVPDEVAPIVGAFFSGLDLTGAGGVKGLKGLSGALKGAKTAEDAARLMKGAGFVDDIIKDYAPMFAKITDAKKIEEGLLAAEKLQNTTVVKGAIIKDGSGAIKAQSSRVADEVGPLRNSATKDISTSETSPSTVEEFVKIKKLDPESITVRDSKNFIVEGTGGEGILRDIPVSIFGKPKFETLNQAKYKSGRLITDPIEVTYSVDNSFGMKPGEYRISDGANRFTQAVANGDKTVPVILTVAKNNKELSGRALVDFKKSLDIPTATPTRSTTAPVASDLTAARSPQTIQSASLPVGEVPQPTIQSLSSFGLNHVSTENARGFQQAVDVGAKTTKEPGLYRRVVSKLGKAFNSTVEVVQDKERLVRKLMENKTMKVSDATNVYQKMTLYTGRTARKVEMAHTRMEQVANDIVNIAHDSGREIADVRADVNKYLHAIHAPERNIALGDGAAGMTTAEAVGELERINALPNAANIKRAAEDMRRLNQEGLVLLKEAGVISNELFTTLTTKYKNHVPLNRIFEGEEITGALSIRGFDVRSSGIKKARGSEREVSDILSNIQHNYEQAVLRSEKNIVDQSTLGFVRDNREALKGIMDVRKPRAVGKDFDGRIMMERTTDPQYLQLYENGKPIWIHIKDPDLAVAIRGVGADKLPKILHAVGAFTRLMAGLATRFNPEFAFPNKLRDLQETMVYAAAQKDLGFRGAAKFVTKDPASIKAVAEFYFGRDTAGTRLYKEMQELGGTTGGLGLSTRKQVELDIDKMIATASSRPRQMFSDVVTYIDNWNAIMEDSTRLSMYKQALAQGASKERAAFLAKEASINFNRMGRGGSVVNALWMFSNVSIQGSAKMIRSLRNPKVAATVITTVGVSVATVNQWNDQVDPQWRDKVTKWDRLNSLPLMIPNANGEGASYIAIPVSWGIKPIKVMADFAYDAASGVDVDAARVTSDLFTSVIEAYNPLGGTDFVSTLVPTFADIPVEIGRNQSWSGSKIKPDYDQNAPADIQYFKTLGETASGKLFIEGTKKLQEMTGIAISPADVKYVFENLIGGAGRFGVKNANAIIGGVIGKSIPLDEYPFVSRFYRERDAEETGQGAAGEVREVDKILQTQSRERFYIKDEAEKLYEQWNNIPKEEARANWMALNKENPDLAKKITEIANQEAKGLTYLERQITELGVENGERAKYLFGKLNELETSEEKKALWELYAEKKIISPDVAKQIKYLIANPQVIKGKTP